MDSPDGTARKSALRTVLRRVVLGVFACIMALIVLLVGEVLLSVVGLSFDPHGYTRIVGVLAAVVLSPLALSLWLLYRSMRRRDT